MTAPEWCPLCADVAGDDSLGFGRLSCAGHYHPPISEDREADALLNLSPNQPAIGNDIGQFTEPVGQARQVGGRSGLRRKLDGVLTTEDGWFAAAAAFQPGVITTATTVAAGGSQWRQINGPPDRLPKFTDEQATRRWSCIVTE